MTDAIGEGGGHDVWPVAVEDGVITQFGFTEHSGILIEMGTFLASEGRFDGYEDCLAGPFPESCATIQMESLDAWAAWHETLEPADRVETVVESWYGGTVRQPSCCRGATPIARHRPCQLRRSRTSRSWAHRSPSKTA